MKNVISKKDVNEAISIRNFKLDYEITNIENKFEPEHLVQVMKDSLNKFLLKKKYSINNSSDTVIEGEFIKIDIGNRFLRYLTMGIAGKVKVAVAGRITVSDQEIQTFNYEVPMTSASWIHTPRFLTIKAVQGCAKKIAIMFQKCQ